jgi:hypothetical protein
VFHPWLKANPMNQATMTPVLRLSIAAAILATGCAPAPQSSSSKSGSPPAPAAASSQNDDLTKALESKVFGGFEEVRVESIKTVMWENFGVPVQFAPGVDINARMNVKYDAKRPSKETIRLGLEPHNLEYVVEGDGLLIRPKAAVGT